LIHECPVGGVDIDNQDPQALGCAFLLTQTFSAALSKLAVNQKGTLPGELSRMTAHHFDKLL
jgi:hypothetical protein